MKKSLAFVCPNYGSVHSAIYRNHMAVVANASRVFDIKYIGVTDKMYLHTASNVLVEQSLEHCIDYIMWTEADMILPFDTITKLYEDIQKTNLDACAGLYFLRGDDGSHPCLYNRLKGNPKYGFTPVLLVPENELFTIDCPGMGCILFKADLFRKVDSPWFDLKEGSYGQDIYFYSKCKDAGIKIGCDSSIQCEHMGDPKMVTIQDYRNWLDKTKNSINRGGFILTHPDKIIKQEAKL